MKKAVLIIGSEGYVGGTIFNTAYQQGVKTIGLTSRTFDFWEQEINWPTVLNQPSQAVIIAANLERCVAAYRPEDASKKNATLEELLAQFRNLLQRFRTHRIIFLSTDAVFSGKAGPYTEDRIVDPITPYAKTKAAMESVVGEISQACSVRMSIIYGPGAGKPDRRRERFLAQLRRDGFIRGATNVFRSPLGVQNVATSVVRLALSDRPIHNIMHLTAPRISYIDFLRIKLVPEESKHIIPWKDPSYTFHDTSLLTTTDWQNMVR